MFDLMTERDDLCETLLGRSGRKIYLPTIDDNSIKDFSFNLFRQQSEKSFKKSLENSVIARHRAYFQLLFSRFFQISLATEQEEIERKIAFRNATSRRNRMTEISFPFYIHFEIIYSRDSPLVLVTEIYISALFVADMHHKSIITFNGEYFQLSLPAFDSISSQ